MFAAQTRASCAGIFNENKILLVKENGKWSLPGGWVDYNDSIIGGAFQNNFETTESAFFYSGFNSIIRYGKDNYRTSEPPTTLKGRGFGNGAGSPD